MDMWNDNFPPLNLFNYSLFYKWIQELELQNPSDGPVTVSTVVDSGDGNTVDDDR